MFFSKKSKSSPANRLEAQDVETPGDPQESRDDQELCLVCLELARWNEFKKDQRQVIKPAVATHGAGGEGYGWKACFEHYDLISTLSWLVMGGKMDITFYNPHEEKRRRARELEAYEEPDENCGCKRCMNDTDRSIWYKIICSQCQQAACIRTTDHRLSCGLPLPWPEVVTP